MPSSSKVMNVFSSAVSNREDFFLCIEFLLQKHGKQEKFLAASFCDVKF